MNLLEKVAKIQLSDFNYILPDELIARFPMAERDSSRLLVYENRKMTHRKFKNISEYLGAQHSLFFNNTKVIPARLYFYKETGALIEFFLFSPISATIEEAMNITYHACWNCAIGNLRKMKDARTLIRKEVFEGKEIEFIVTILDSQSAEFRWNSGHTFAKILNIFGEMPLPPYLKREVEESDKTKYQTVYNQVEGAVAAPTAGLHFTEDLIQNLEKQGVETNFLTLHVGAGTFQPIKTDNIIDHPMHSEQIIVSQENVRNLLKNKKIVAVGTTSLRTLESLYWFGFELLKNPDALFKIEKLVPYQQPIKTLPTAKQALEKVLEIMQKRQINEIIGQTEIMIVPSYSFQICDALVTNFHLPSTTLMMLIAAFVGSDWKKIYQEALNKKYRFLSFGDASLLFRKV